jgi:hypothetical protein
MVFTDCKTAFNSVERGGIRKSFEKIGIAVKRLSEVRNIYERTVNCVKTNKGQSAWFRQDQE